MTAAPLPDPWDVLRRWTPARIALGRAGSSLPTAAWLDFALAHARARDALQAPFEPAALAAECARRGWDTLCLHSAARDQREFLLRPDLGRQLSAHSQQILLEQPRAETDLVVLVGDGLSPRAATAHALPLLERLLPKLQARHWRIAPVCLVRFARVAVQDDVGERLHARLALILLGERPGLGAPDSLGAYFVHAPRPGRTNAERNCVSNIRPDGLPLPDAAETLFYLLEQARLRRLSGVALKDDRTLPLTGPASAGMFPRPGT